MASQRADRPEAKSRRLFVAVEIDEAAQDAIDAAIEPWRALFPKARWSPRANRHVTIRFLGPVWPRLVDDVEDAVVATAAAAAVPFGLALAGFGRFPDRGKARVLWIGPDDPAGALPALAAGLQERLPREFPPETRPFSAHMTVARSDPLDLPATWLETPVRAVTWRVDHLTLFESHLERPHARYEPIARCALGDVAGPPADPR